MSSSYPRSQTSQPGTNLRTRLLTLVLFAVVVYPLLVDASYLIPSLALVKDTIGSPYADAQSSILLNVFFALGGTLTIIYMARTAHRGVLPSSHLQTHLDRAETSTSMDSPESVIIFPTSDELREEEEDSESALLLSRTGLRAIEVWKNRDDEDHPVKLVLTRDRQDVTFLGTFARVMKIAGYAETSAYPEFLRQIGAAVDDKAPIRRDKEQMLLFNVEKRGGYPYSKLEPPNQGNFVRNIALALEDADYAVVQILFGRSEKWKDSAKALNTALEGLHDEEKKQMHSPFAQEAARWGLQDHSALSIRGFAISTDQERVYDSLNAAVSGVSGIYDGLTVKKCANPLLIRYILERSIPEFSSEVKAFDKGVFKRWRNFSVIPILTSELAIFLRMPHADTSIQDRIEYRPSVLEPQAIDGKRTDHFIEF